MTALVVGAVLALAALLYVLRPLFGAAVLAPPSRRRRAARPSTSAIDALREIEFDRATGKLSDEDYAALKATYTRAALVEMRSGDAAGSAREPAPAADAATAAAVDAAEAAIRRYRAVRRDCPACGPRPEPDPAFCSSCGRYLKGRCAHCGAAVDATAARVCASCGGSLAT